MEKNGDLDRMKNKYEEALNAGVNKVCSPFKLVLCLKIVLCHF